MTDRGLIRSIVDRSLAPTEGRASAAATDAGPLLARWERLLGADPVSGGSLFEKRLAALGLTRDGARDRLAPRELPPDAPLPAWAELLEEVLLVHGAAPAPADPLALSGEEHALWGFDVAPVPLFPEALGTFVAVAGLRVTRAWGRARTPARMPDALAPCWRYLLVRLSRIAARTLAYEVKRASSEWRLPGDSPESRYQHFMSELLGSRAGLADLFTRYPVLARLLATCAADVADAIAELGARTARDARLLARAFNSGRAPGEVVTVVPGLSDPHDGARTVCRVTFASGLALIYKPRSLAADVAYAGVATLAGGGRDAIRTPIVVDRGAYGWSERIAERPCKTAAAVAAYFRRQGRQLAVLYLLRGHDFHAENFVAHGARPVAVDLEGIAAPGPDDLDAAAPPAFRAAAISAFATGMLPRWEAGDEGRTLSVSSVLSGTGGRPYARRWPAWQGIGTDTLRLEYSDPARPAVTSLPILNGKRVTAEHYVDDVLRGFAGGYRAIVRRRRAILDRRISRLLARAYTRRLIRGTREYFDLLFWSSAPDQLTSGAAYDVALEMLWRGGPAVDPLAAPLVEHEKACLWRGDIPAFRAATTSRYLRGYGGRSTRVRFQTPALAQVRRQLRSASEADLRWQRQLIRASLAMTFEKSATLKAATRRRRGDDPLPAAAAIGDALGALAIRDELGVRWLDLARAPFSPTQIGPVVAEPWLHSGSAGTALFLAHLAHRTGSAAYADLADRSLTYAWNVWRFLCSSGRAHTVPLSGFTGAPSLAYAFAECGALLGKSAWIDRATVVARSIEVEPIRRMTNPDLLGGAAGVALAMLRVHRARPEAMLLERAQAAADAILAARLTDGEGGGWRPPFANRALLGAAHGAAGIVHALAAMDRAAPGPALQAAVTHGLAFERERFSAEHGDWPNLQSRSADPHFMTGWCAGAAGIGLSRLALVETGRAPSADLVADLDRAIGTTIRHLGSGQHHLCCGEAGRIVFLMAAGADRPEAARAGREAARALVRTYADGGWALHSFRERVILPSLFSGASGIGLSLLAAAGATGAERILLLS